MDLRLQVEDQARKTKLRKSAGWRETIHFQGLDLQGLTCSAIPTIPTTRNNNEQVTRRLKVQEPCGSENGGYMIPRFMPIQ
jgi:hypothetical protein